MGLARVALIAQTQNPEPSEAGGLYQKLCNLLTHEDECHRKELWPDPSRLLTDHAKIWQLAQAWIAAEGDLVATAVAWDEERLGSFVTESACRLVVIASALEKVTPSVSAKLSMMAAEKSNPHAQIRCLGAAARYFAKAGDYQQSALALRRLLDTSSEVILNSRQELGYGLRTSSALGWTAPKDEIHQRWLIAHAGSEPTALLKLAQELEFSRCTPELYLSAVDLARYKGQAEVADALWERAWDYYPSSPLLKDRVTTEE